MQAIRAGNDGILALAALDRLGLTAAEVEQVGIGNARRLFGLPVSSASAR